jgi:hypothetical protein
LTGAGTAAVCVNDEISARLTLGGKEAERTSALGCDFLDQLLHVDLIDALLSDDLCSKATLT